MCIVLWYSSGTEATPNGSRRNLYLPKGLLNVHSLELASSSFSCQNPDDASSLLKYSAFANCDIISSLVGSLKCSLFIALFRSLGSIQTLGFLFFFSTITRDKFVQWLLFPVKVITSLWLPSLLFTDLFPRGIWWGEPKREEVWVCSPRVNNGSPQTPGPGPASHETPWRCYWPRG